VVIYITLPAGFVPLLQVTFIVLLENFYLGRLTVKDRDKTHMIIVLILIMWYQITGLITASVFNGLFDMWIVLIQAVSRSASLFVGVEVDLVADWFQIVLSSEVFRSARISWADRSATRGDCDEELLLGLFIRILVLSICRAD
jgi:hypothetical protein